MDSSNLPSIQQDAPATTDSSNLPPTQQDAPAAMFKTQAAYRVGMYQLICEQYRIELQHVTLPPRPRSHLFLA
jgi:hypothetical protein